MQDQTGMCNKKLQLIQTLLILLCFSLMVCELTWHLGAAFAATLAYILMTHLKLLCPLHGPCIVLLRAAAVNDTVFSLNPLFFVQMSLSVFILPLLSLFILPSILGKENQIPTLSDRFIIRILFKVIFVWWNQHTKSSTTDLINHHTRSKSVRLDRQLFCVYL